MKLSQLIVEDSCYKDMAVRIDPNNADELYQATWLKIKEIELRDGIVTENPKGYFYMAMKSIFIDNKRKEIVRNNYRHVIVEETIYQKALDQVLSEDNELSNLVKLYLEMPNLKKISEFTNLEYRVITRIYKDARIYIKSIADRMANDDDFDSDYNTHGEYTLLD